MPSKDNHIATARENRVIAMSLLDSDPKSLAWATTICFYAGLHLVEAALAHDGRHFDNHASRNMHLKRTNQLQKIWTHYKPLYDHSLKARYLMTNGGSAELLIAESLGEDGVKEKIVNHHLLQIERSVSKLLGIPKVFESST